VTITSCRRIPLLRETLESLRERCGDIERVSRWICVDDGSSEEDLKGLAEAYPWLEVFRTDPDRRGQPAAIRLLWSLVGTSIGQCLVNLNYAETLADYDLAGGMPFQHEGRSYVAQLLDPDRRVIQGLSNGHWPHFSLRPGLTRIEAWDLGFRDVPFFERDLAVRYTAAGWRTVFLPDIYHRHIGKLTTEGGENAYDLNHMPQF
jgi:hypothetical protein